MKNNLNMETCLIEREKREERRGEMGGEGRGGEGRGGEERR